MQPSTNNEEKGLFRTAVPLFSASFAAQGINFLTLFLLPWLFAAEEIGPFFVFSAIGQIFLPLISLQSYNSIVLSRNHQAAHSNFWISFFIGGAFSLLLLVLVFIIYETPLFIFFKDWKEWMLFIPLYAFLGNTIVTLEYYLTYTKAFSLIGIARFVKALITFLLTLGLGWLSPLSESIIWALLGGQLIMLVFLFLRAKASFNHQIIKVRNYRIFFFRNRDILIYNTLIVGLLQLINYSPFVLLSFFFGEGVVAFYGLAHRIFSTPLSLWGQSIGQVFYKRCVEIYNASHPLFHFVSGTLKKMLTGFIPLGLISIWIAPWLFSVLLGQEWQESGPIAQLIIPLIVIQSLAMPFTMLFTVLNTQRRMIWIYFGGFIIRILLGFVIPAYFFNLEYKPLFAIFSGIGVLYYIFYLYDIFGQVKSYEKMLKK